MSSQSETPNVGDRVRATYVYEGEVRKVHETGAFDLRGGENYCGESFHGNGRDLPKGTTRTITILERAKPAWQDGDVAMYADELRFRLGGVWLDNSGNQHSSRDSTADELGYKLILRDGKPV